MSASATASASQPARPPARPAPRPGQEFHLVESRDGWRLKMTLTDRLRQAIARGEDLDDVRFTVRVTPNLVPGEPFEAQLVIEEPGQHS
jgi:hypothetical protein